MGVHSRHFWIIYCINTTEEKLTTAANILSAKPVCTFYLDHIFWKVISGLDGLQPESEGQ